MKLKPFHPLSQGLLMSFLFNENGGSQVYDATGNQNHGTGTNLAWGRDGLDLPGVNERITVPNFINLNDDWSIFTSFTQDTRNPDSQTYDTILAAIEAGTGTSRSILYIDDNPAGGPTYKLRSFIDGASHTANTVIETGTAYTAGLTQNGTAFYFYLNGKEDGNFTAAASAANGDIILFDHAVSTANGCFDGTVGVFHWYDHTLNAAEMMWLDYDSFCMFKPDFTPHYYVVPTLPGGGYVLPAPSHPRIKPRWVAPVGIMESVVTYNCRKCGMPRPVLAMPFWEGAGNRAIDLSGYGNHATFHNEANWIAEGVGFDGTNDYMQIPNSDPIDFADESFAASMWFNTATTSVDNYIFSKNYGGDGVKWYGANLNTSHQYINCFVDDGTTNSIAQTTDDFNDGTWHNLVYVRDIIANKVIAYIDGAWNAEVVDASGSIANTGNLTIGVRTDLDVDKFFDGSLRLFTIYDVAPTAQEVKFLYDDPYFMYRLPEEMYGSASAAPIPLIIHHLRQQGIL